MSPPIPQIPTKNYPFLFPKVQSSVLSDPSRFFSRNLLSSPLPTNSFFQNFTLKNGDQPEYIHPYFIKSAGSSLSICYPSFFHSPSFIYQNFVPDLTIFATDKTTSASDKSHVISSYSDLSLTLDIPSSKLRFFLVRGSPFLTCSVTRNTRISISTVHAILSFSSNSSLTKHTIKLNNGQTWIIYALSSISFNHRVSLITSGAFSGILRIVVLSDSDPTCESIVDQFCSCYPTSGVAVLTKSFSVEYKWEKEGQGDLLMLAHPLHLDIIWVNEESYAEIVTSLAMDVDALDSSAITTKSVYFYGKLIARAARLDLIAEEVCFLDVIPAIRKFLKDTIEPWLDGTFNGNGFLYESKWGGIVSKQGSTDSEADFGFGVYNDHNCHIGYFLYGIAVLTKIDPGWGRRYKPQAYSLVADFMNLGSRSNSNYPRMRCFDFYKLHSWAGGLAEFADGRNQESTSEAVNGFYSAALMGLAYGDTHLVATGSTLTALVIQAAQTWDSGLWFAPPDWRECRLGIQLLPLLPISEILFSDIEYTRQLVNWALAALGRDVVGDGWKGFVYALEAIYDKESALEKIRNLSGHDDGNSLTNLLWWVHSRGD
ncbi:hypothetical protein GOBAR_AA11055 [Gossypium barbadense]|uniref:glucan endo-1,3-beta-D-glucosidase n=1 Tax=Gossypium barbadense TaxID=3634 RepID=A0A2P5Y1Z3_GOSBA|nr:hypothetical protein GOBAR_AA11055 [Gossypium barbadense]